MLNFELFEVLAVLIDFDAKRINVGGEYIVVPLNSLGAVDYFDKLIIGQTFHQLLVVGDWKIAKVIAVLEQFSFKLL